ncbi:MAG: chromate resistance protein ChrB domain-containing protein [Pseudomonadota bacterium]
MPGPNMISPAQLSRLIGLPDAPLILDVRLPQDAALDPRLLPGSQRVAHSEVARLAPALTGRRVVVTCQRGRKLSEGAAAVLRLHGLAAEVLEGGFLSWAAAGLPLMPEALMPQTALWVTRHRPKIDRIACPWLIRRFINPEAKVLFVAPAEVAAVATQFNATPFDIEGIPYSHRGAGCTFDALLDDFGLHSDALDRLALVVRAADTDRHDLSPQAAGLLALSVGLSRQYRDDLAQLEAGMALYDALYRWARDGFDEGHDWPAGRAP